ncbi:hypothetical protein BC835DRAFT_1275717 [Cytidiella melzeri]|nr:hypothetical protein BC835DRAFT_1275717 [Cytidiella melzeri]
MPRLIPRLLQALARSPSTRSHSPRVCSSRRTTRTTISPPPLASATALLSPHRRTRSVLLEDVNPITHKDAFRRQRTLEPRVHVPSVAKRKSKAETSEDESMGEQRRVMTAEEYEWWANPYLRMLSKPMRRCIVTDAYQPTDFMIRLAAMRVPTTRPNQPPVAFLPDGIEHPRFRGRRAGNGHYVLCYKDAVEHLLGHKGKQKRYLDTTLPSDPTLPLHIGHLLRVRVLQELELLTLRLQCGPQGCADRPILRRLRRSEWEAIKTTGTIPHKGAVAIIVLPPLNKDPVTKQLPEPSSTTLPTEPGISRSVDKYPVSVLHPTASRPWNEDAQGLPTLLSQEKVPLYNGVALFPLRSQRAALHLAMNKLLGVELDARHKERTHQLRRKLVYDRESHPKDKGSHAYMLYSTGDSLLRADSVPLAIALWRLRMYEGEGWKDDQNGQGFFMRNPPWWDRNAE